MKFTVIELQPKKSIGHDGINSKKIKLIANEIENPLTYVINNWLERGCFAKIFRIAIITPLTKVEIEKI